MSSVVVIGDSGALALAGPAAAVAGPSVVIALDGAAPPTGATAPVVRWWRHAAPAGAATDGERVVAPSGAGLWSAAPWPVHPQVFELGAAPAGSVLVVDPDDARRAALVAELAGRGIDAADAPWLTLESLAGASIVLSAVGPAQPLIGDALSVLAAGRLLITNAAPSFGLVPGFDHLRAEGPAPAADLVEAVVERPATFEALCAMGRIAAARHRADDVYARIASDLEMLGDLGRVAVEDPVAGDQQDGDQPERDQ